MRRIVTNGCLRFLGPIFRKRSQLSAFFGQAADTQACLSSFSSSALSVYRLVSLCRLLQMIVDEQGASHHERRRRISGVVRRMEEGYVHWLADCGPEKCEMVLTSLAGASRHLKNYNFLAGANADQDREWSGASPYFSPAFNDWLCVLLQRGARHATHSAGLLPLLEAAAALQLADAQTLGYMCRRLTAQQYTASASLDELVCVLRLVSLLVKRCRMPIPSLERLLSRLHSASLDSRQSLIVLSSLLRLRERLSVDVVRAISRRAAEHTATYTKKDVVYALEAIALLNCCHETFARAVFDRCTALHADLQPRELGGVCKYVGLLSRSRANKDLLLLCAKELRRLLPALLARTEQLLGRFSPRDARHVLCCFEQHRVHHSVVFSRLTPLALEN